MVKKQTIMRSPGNVSFLENSIKEINGHLERFDSDRIMRIIPDLILRLNAIYYEITGKRFSNNDDNGLGDEDEDEDDVCASPTRPYLSTDHIVNRYYPFAAYINSSTPTRPLPFAGLSLETSTFLSNGVSMPVMGLGTWELTGEQCYKTVLQALQVGYRHIDTSQAYQNEQYVGRAIRKAIQTKILKRSELFVTTKVVHAPTQSDLMNLVHWQIEALQCDYIDLYLLHVPMQNRLDIWKALERLVAKGTIRALGVSNFNKPQLVELYESVQVKPVVLQNKFDVYHLGKQLTDHTDMEMLALDLGIQIVAWSPLNSHPYVLNPRYDPIVNYIAQRRNSSAAQIILRYILQRGVAVIPKSTDVGRMRENMMALSLPELTASEFALLATLPHLISSSIYRASV